jgi:hypothetical protein
MVAKECLRISRRENVLGNVLQNIRGNTSFLIFGTPFWRNGTFRIYERPFQDAESCQACPYDVRRLLLRFRVVRFQRCEVRGRLNVSHHTVECVTSHRYRGGNTTPLPWRNCEGTLPFGEDILDMRNDCFSRSHIAKDENGQETRL